MATIQLRRQLKFAHPKSEAIKYIENKLIMLSGEPLLCTYRENNGKWGAIDVVCIYPKGTPRNMTTLNNVRYDSLFKDGVLVKNILKNNADEMIWEEI